MSFGKYIKAAFTNRWNLLSFLGALGFAVLSPIPDAAAAIVMAGELTYLAMLSGHPKFQKSVDAQEAKASRQTESQAAEQALDRIMKGLPKPALDRFQALRERCMELRELAAQIKTPSSLDASATLDNFQDEGLDRLLWIYLRLLYTQHALKQFLSQSDEKARQRQIDSLEEQLAKLGPAGDNPTRERARKTVEDNLNTSRERLANYRKARENHDLLELEIQRLENKIQSLGELAINRQEPEYVSSQIDQVASSMVETEKTMNDLRFATGLDDLHESVPQLVARPAIVVSQ